jgi:hypothetical protein
MWCVAELDERYIEKMEDVLAVYEKPYNPPNPSFAWMRNQSRCMPTCARPSRPSRGS